MSNLPWQQAEDFNKMKDWGFNFCRYLVFWSAIEPSKGHYDTTYIRDTRIRLIQLKQAGVDVMLDFHQDLYAERFTGNGFPDWTVNDDSFKFVAKTPWNLNYLEPAVVASYTNFWKNDSQKTFFINAIDYTLSQFDSLVIGIDVMNEPFPGLDFDFEKTVLSDFYTKIQVRLNKYKARVFFEPWMSTSAGLYTNLIFSPVPNSAYAPHYYDPLVHEGQPYKSSNKTFMKNAVGCKIYEAEKFKVPIIFGEFWVPPAAENSLNYLRDFLQFTGESCVGWAFYSYDIGNIIDEQKKTKPCMDILIEIYAQKIAGIDPIISYKTNSFSLKYDACGIKEPTVIFIPDSYKNVLIKINGEEHSVEGTLFKYSALTGSQDIEITWN